MDSTRLPSSLGTALWLNIRFTARLYALYSVRWLGQARNGVPRPQPGVYARKPAGPAQSQRRTRDPRRSAACSQGASRPCSARVHCRLMQKTRHSTPPSARRPPELRQRAQAAGRRRARTRLHPTSTASRPSNSPPQRTQAETVSTLRLGARRSRRRPTRRRSSGVPERLSPRRPARVATAPRMEVEVCRASTKAPAGTDLRRERRRRQPVPRPIAPLRPSPPPPPTPPRLLLPPPRRHLRNRRTTSASTTEVLNAMPRTESRWRSAARRPSSSRSIPAQPEEGQSAPKVSCTDLDSRVQRKATITDDPRSSCLQPPPDAAVLARLVRDRSPARQGQVRSGLHGPDENGTALHRRAQVLAQGGDRQEQGREAGSPGDRDPEPPRVSLFPFPRLSSALAGSARISGLTASLTATRTF